MAGATDDQRQGHKRLMRTAVLTGACACTLLVGLSAGPGAAQAGKKFWGVSLTGSPAQSEFNRMENGGLGSVRWTPWWPTVQKEKNGSFHWGSVDAIVERAALSGMRPLPTLYGSPRWIARKHARPPLGSAWKRRAWKRYLREAVKRYGPGGKFWTDATDPKSFRFRHPGARPRPIRHWQVWNEQNSSLFYKPRPSVRGYARLLRISKRAIRSEHSKAKIVLGGMFGTPQSPRSIYSWRFLNRLYKQKGAKRHFDIAGIHPYSPNRRGIRYQMRRLRRVMRKNRDGRTRTWVSELGWGSSKRCGRGRKGQARMLQRSFRLLRSKRRRWKLYGVVWFTWRDTPRDGSCKWWQSAGLFDKDLNPKPAWRRYKRLIR